MKQPFSVIIPPIFKLLIEKANAEIVSVVSNNIRKSMESQSTIEFPVEEEQILYLVFYEFKEKFEISHSTISKDSESLVLTFPRKLDNSHINYFRKQGLNPKR